MKTREERAKEYAVRTWPDQPEKIVAANMGYRAGSIAEHEELTRWNKPEEPPKGDGKILIKFKPGVLVLYDIGWYNAGSWVDVWCHEIDVEKILGWREIHE